MSPISASDSEDQSADEVQLIEENDSTLINIRPSEEPFLRNSLDTATKLLKAESKSVPNETAELSAELMAELQVIDLHKVPDGYFGASRP